MADEDDNRRLNESFSLEKQGTEHQESAYEMEEQLFPVAMRKKPRYFPSSQIMISSSQSKPPCPLIQEFLRAVGKEELIQEEEKEPSVEEGKATDPQTVLTANSLDDPHFSTISMGQHRRFAQLSDKNSAKTQPLAKTEFKKLGHLVREEQTLYAQALLAFWQGQKARLSTGFLPRKDAASGFAELAIEQGNLTLDQWTRVLKLGVRYGKCCQIISLVPTGRSSSASQKSQPQHVGNLVQTIQRKRLRVDAATKATTDTTSPHATVQDSKSAFTLEIGSKIVLPSVAARTAQLSEPSSTCLLQDPDALRLAKEHKADLVMTEATLFNLMRAPDIGSWIVPTARTGEGFLVVEQLTITTFSSPRECLTRGVRQALLNSASPKSAKETLKWEYILLTLPPLQQKTRRVLVRREQVPANPDHPNFRWQVHLEYFPERGSEISSHSDKAWWMLEFMLDPQAHVVVAKVDPSTRCLVGKDEVSLAHVLMGEAIPAVQRAICEDSHTALDRWHNLCHLLSAFCMIGPGQHVACYPSHTAVPKTSPVPLIGVHKILPAVAPNDKKGGGDEAMDVTPLLQSAGEVPLGAASLARCFRPWTWQEERTPYTFPIKKKTTN